jgi:tripartite-type tricarboxylate transporter receptor subunit TctC
MKRLLFVLLVLVSSSATAQQWPTKTVRLIVGFAAGVGPDVFLRAAADSLTKRTGQSFVVENITGGGGLIAAQAAARAAPDGHTLYMGGIGVIATDRYLYKQLPYDPDRSFIPAAMVYVSNGGFAIAVHPSVPASTLPELIALAKANPGKLAYGTDTIGVTALVGQWFAKLAGIEMQAIPYKSPAPLMSDFIAGRTQVAVTTTANMEPFRKTARFRILGVSSLTRMPGYEEVPPIAETLPGFKMNGAGLLLTPAGTPEAVVRRINQEMDAVVKEPGYQKRLVENAYLPMDGAGTAQSIAEYIGSERAYWERIMKGLNVEPQ